MVKIDAHCVLITQFSLVCVKMDIQVCVLACVHSHCDNGLTVAGVEASDEVYTVKCCSRIIFAALILPFVSPHHVWWGNSELNGKRLWKYLLIINDSNIIKAFPSDQISAQEKLVLYVLLWKAIWSSFSKPFLRHVKLQLQWLHQILPPHWYRIYEYANKVHFRGWSAGHQLSSLALHWQVSFQSFCAGGSTFVEVALCTMSALQSHLVSKYQKFYVFKTATHIRFHVLQNVFI